MKKYLFTFLFLANFVFGESHSDRLLVYVDNSVARFSIDANTGRTNLEELNQEMDNIVLSPHNSALTLECRKRMAIESCENIVYYLNNKSKLNINNIVNGKNINLEV